MDTQNAKYMTCAVSELPGVTAPDHLRESDSRDASLRLEQHAADFSTDNARVVLRRRCALNGLQIRDVCGDGACLFRAVSVMLYGVEDRHMEVRRNAVRYVGAHWADFYWFAVNPITGVQEEKTTWTRRMLRQREWGDQLTLAGITNHYGLGINIVESASYITSPGFITEVRSTGDDVPDSALVITLAYLQDMHYMATAPMPLQECEVAVPDRKEEIDAKVEGDHSVAGCEGVDDIALSEEELQQGADLVRCHLLSHFLWGLVEEFEAGEAEVAEEKLQALLATPLISLPLELDLCEGLQLHTASRKATSTLPKGRPSKKQARNEQAGMVKIGIRYKPGLAMLASEFSPLPYYRPYTFVPVLVEEPVAKGNKRVAPTPSPFPWYKPLTSARYCELMARC